MSLQVRTSYALIIPIVAIALLAIAFHTPAPAQGGGAGLIAGGAPPDLMLLYTGDVIGYLDPCG